jgi:hypothetical protein
LRTALLKQSYLPPDLDALFEVPPMPDLSIMFAQQRKRFVSASPVFRTVQSFKERKLFFYFG